MLSKMKLKKSLMLLILLVALSFKSFSQTDTLNNKILLTEPVAKLVIKDLINYDGLSIEMKTMQSILSETNNKLLAQNDLVLNLQMQNNNLDTIIKNLNKKFDTQEQLTADFELALKRQKRQATIYKVGALIGGAATLLLLVQ